jgi:hypothetical protein
VNGSEPPPSHHSPDAEIVIESPTLISKPVSFRDDVKGTSGLEAAQPEEFRLASTVTVAWAAWLEVLSPSSRNIATVRNDSFRTEFSPFLVALAAPQWRFDEGAAEEALLVRLYFGRPQRKPIVLSPWNGK